MDRGNMKPEYIIVKILVVAVCCITIGGGVGTQFGAPYGWIAFGVVFMIARLLP
jgi:hypothetical protein